MNNYIRHRFNKVIIGIVLLFLIIGGCIVVMHDCVWTLDDATAVLINVGSGVKQTFTNGYGYSPSMGRFFPCAYLHNNIVLLFTEGYLEAWQVYVINACLWAAFVMLLYFLAWMILKGRVIDKYAQWIALLMVLIMGQRVFPMYTILWATLYVDYVVVLCICMAYYFYCKMHSYWWLAVIMLLVNYFIYCGEQHVIMPIVMGVLALCNLNRAEKRDWLLGLSMIGSALIFVVLYLSLIYPNVVSVYDSGHGTSDSILTNAIKIFLSQKLLFIIIGVFVVRLYEVFVRKQQFDNYSDVLLSISIGLIGGSLVLRLSPGLYYYSAILFAIPAMLNVLNFNNIRSAIASWIAILIVTLYFGIKIPSSIKYCWNTKKQEKQEIQFFDAQCQQHEAICYYVSPNSLAIYGDELYHEKCHVAHLMHNRNHILPFILDYEGSSCLLIMPKNVEISEVISQMNSNVKNFEYMGTAKNCVLYNYKKNCE